MKTLYTASFGSPIGHIQIASTEEGLAYLSLPRASGRGLMGWHQRHRADHVVRAGYQPNRDAIAQVGEYLEGKRQEFDLALDLAGTAFQLLVYRELAAIPYGQWCSYSDVANRLKHPTAVRAVAAATSSNPIPLVVPCHRVLASTGQTQGYAGGLDLMKKLLAMENAVYPGHERSDQLQLI